jgi:very-short-patch-repair endonuclease
MRLRVLDMGVPRPELQIPVYDMFGVVRFYLDMGWPQWMLALEYDGVEFHPEDRADHDSSRRDWITARGWVVRAYRNTDIFTTSQAFEHEVMGLVQTSRRRWRGTLGA